MSKTKFAIKLLRSFCPPHLLEEIEGDLLQRYQRDINPLNRRGRMDKYWQRRANRRLLWNVIQFFRLEISIRNKMSLLFGSLRMLSNYFKTTYRHASKNKLNFIFKVSGLT